MKTIKEQAEVVFKGTAKLKRLIDNPKYNPEPETNIDIGDSEHSDVKPVNCDCIDGVSYDEENLASIRDCPKGDKHRKVPVGKEPLRCKYHQEKHDTIDNSCEIKDDLRDDNEHDPEDDAMSNDIAYDAHKDSEIENMNDQK